MRQKFTMPFVVGIVALGGLAAHAQVIADIDRPYPNELSSAALVWLAPGPLVEGAQAYADRTHVYKNVPLALVGAEYILMSNEDKYNPNHELHLTIGQAGTLYLFIDNRVGTHVKDPALSANPEAAGMTWVAQMGFIDTGMKMAVDESADGSIDNYFTVFSIAVSPGVVVLKAQNDMYLGGPYDRNMYGVAAVGSRQATNPVPVDEGWGGLRPLLQWTPGVGAVSHNVYLGTNQRLGPGQLIASDLQTPFYQFTEGLAVGVTYYWRVDEVGAEIVKGDVWSFTTEVERVADVDLVGWWKLDDEGVGVALDSSSWGRHGILYGDPLWVPGRIGSALRFDGMDDYVDTNYYENLPVWTVSAWVISPRAPGETGVGGPVHRQANYQFNWNHHDTNFQGTAALYTGDTWHPASFGPLFANQWYHLAATFDGSSLKAYTNGDLITTNTEARGVPLSEPASLKIGRHADGPWYFEGTVDDVRVYSRALTIKEIGKIVQGEPLIAGNPQPASGSSVGIHDANALSWSAGEGAALHDIYFGSDEAAVRAADIMSPLYRGRQAEAEFALDGLIEAGYRYFWRIDEVANDGTIYRGRVWTFTVSHSLVVDDFESYTQDEGSRLAETWLDGITNKTGSRVGHLLRSPAQPIGAHGGASMILDYDNTRTPFISEVERAFVPEQDWIAGGGHTLSVWLQGDVVSFGETTPGTYTMSATGTDIWVGGDEFRYAYKRLDGDGAIVVKVEGVVNTDIWAKAGVMIRESLDPMAAYAFMLVTPDGLRAFQNRLASNSWTCFSAHSWSTMRMPSWVKLEREGDYFYGYHSVDGVNWIRQSELDNTGPDPSLNPQIIRMPSYVYVGLALTSHAPGIVTTAKFSGVEITGDVIGEWQVAEIGVAQPGNSPDDVYVTVEDSDGKIAAVVNPDLGAVNATAWTMWEIPLSDFVDVDLSRVKKMSIGVGGREAATPPGAGRIYVDDISVSKQTTNPILGIYLVDPGELVLSTQDMAAYLRATHEIVLNESGIQKWNSYITFSDAHDPPIPATGKLYQKQFVLRIDDREIYRGHFWSGLSSLSCEGVVILDAILPCDNVHNTISIENGYPGSLPGADDPRENAELFNFLAAKGLLK